MEDLKPRLKARLLELLRHVRTEMHAHIEMGTELISVDEHEVKDAGSGESETIRQHVPWVGVLNAPGSKEREKAASHANRMLGLSSLPAPLSLGDALGLVEKGADSVVDATHEDLTDLVTEFIAPDLRDHASERLSDAWPWSLATQAGSVLTLLVNSCTKLPPAEVRLGRWPVLASVTEVARWARPFIAKHSEELAEHLVQRAEWRVVPPEIVIPPLEPGAPSRRISLTKLALLHKAEKQVQLKLSLLDNALDFFQEAIRDLEEEDEERKGLKYSILNAAAAVELVLKARLAKEHWTLIFANPGKASLESFLNGSFLSVDFEGVQQRIESICQIDLSVESVGHLGLGPRFTRDSERLLELLLRGSRVVLKSQICNPRDRLCLAQTISHSSEELSRLQCSLETFPWSFKVAEGSAFFQPGVSQDELSSVSLRFLCRSNRGSVLPLVISEPVSHSRLGHGDAWVLSRWRRQVLKGLDGRQGFIPPASFQEGLYQTKAIVEVVREELP